MALDQTQKNIFPAHGLLPKREIGAERFLTKYPSYDGRGILIAIFDSGVDPGAPGLQKLPDGSRKILDLIDCSSSGDVDMSVTRTPKDGYIEGLSGKMLKIPEHWQNPSSTYHVGLKSGYSLFPGKLKERIQKERKQKFWDVEQSNLHAQAARDLVEFEKKSPDLNDKSIKLKYENLKATCEVLQTFNKKYKDPGPVYDCVTFHDGKTWRVCIDTTENGELEHCSLLSSFRESGDYARFSDIDMLNYSVNVYNEGKTLSIVTNCSSHGTHVASIASAYFENDTELNGIAPGAQIISMKIGDTKLDSMETGTSLMRAMIVAVQNKVDVINMSYGEGCKWPNAGQISNMMNKLSKEHGIIFVSSAGNNGPALSTVGSPGGTCQGVIGVAAYVSPDMMAAEYSLLEKMPGKHYTWSSRGPCVDGSLGVCITAPGGAFTSVPNWTLRSSQLMNGTSMSSPNACGGVALLLSALKMEGISYSPISVRKYIESSALKIEGSPAFRNGYGMLQVDKAFESMKQETREWINNVDFEIDCGAGRMRGIYLREWYEINNEMTTTVTVTPSFKQDFDNAKKIDFSVRVCLLASVPWITAPSHLVLANMGRTVAIRVDSRGLGEGAHYGEVVACDVENPELTPVFRIPVTVIIPSSVGHDCIVDNHDAQFKPGDICRYFYRVPDGATWAKISMKSLSADKEARYLIHAIQLVPDLAFRETEFHKYLNLKPLAESNQHFKVISGRTLELSLARWWANIGNSKLSWELSFHGLESSNSSVCLNGCEGYKRIDFKCSIRPEEILPSATLSHYVLPLTPREHTLLPLGERDVLPDGQQMYQLMLVYYFSLSRGAEVVPVAHLMYDLLYESKFSSQFWMIFDNNKRLYGSGDAFPYKNNYVVKLEKGEYILKFEIRHPKQDCLETFKDMVLNLSIKLNTAITLDCYSKRKSILKKGNKGKFTAKTLQPGHEVSVYVTALSEDKFPKGIKQGQYLTGTIALTKKETTKKVTSIPLQCFVPPAKSSSDKTLKPKEQKEITEDYENAHIDFVVSWIPKLQGTSLQTEIVDKFDENISVRNAYLNALDSSKDRNNILEKIIEEADKTISLINSEELLKYFGSKADSSPSPSKTKRKMDDQKSMLINALYKKGLAIADVLISRSTAVVEKETKDESGVDSAPSPDAATGSKCTLDALDLVYDEFMKWVDHADLKMKMLATRHGMAHKHHGLALKALLKYQEDSALVKSYDDVLIQICDTLGWTHIAKYLRRWSLLKYPPNFEPCD